MEWVTDDVARIDMPRPDLTPPWKPQTTEPVGCHVLVGERRVLFGTGYGFSADRLATEVEAAGGIDAVIAEHGDPDHFGGIPELRRRDDDLIVAIPRLDAAVPDKYYADWHPDVEFEGGDERWGLKAVHVPGHTPGNMAFVDASRGYLFAGDTVVHSDSELAADGEWRGPLAPIVPMYNKASTADARRNTSRLAELDVDAVFLTHGRDVESGAAAAIRTLVEDLDAR